MTGAEDPWVIRSTIAAVVAAVISFFSLIAILRQIHFAKKEIDLVRDDLENSKAVLKYADEQSRLVQQQMAEMRRRPNLAICFQDGRDLCILERPVPGQINVPIMFYIINRGERTSTNANAQVFVPLHLLPVVNRDAPRFTINEMSCVYFELVVREHVWPSDVPSILQNSQITLNFQPGNHNLYWRLVDDFGRHPPNGNYQKLVVMME
jgi:hypothetical protein